MSDLRSQVGRDWCEQCQSWRFSQFHCGRDECPKPETTGMKMALAERKVPDPAFQVLVADHSGALKFVREMSIQPCPHWCAGDCLACRAKAWLHEAKK